MLDNEVPNRFVATSANSITYQGHGRLPTPNRRTYGSLTTGVGRFYGRTSYGENFLNKSTENQAELFVLERMRLKESKARHQRGTISPFKPLPFLAKR